MWAKVEKAEYIERECSVYDLTVDGEMYFVHGVAVHNCPHSWLTKPLKDTVPDCASLWRGQVKTGRKGEGTEALIDALTGRVTEGDVLEYNPYHDAEGRFTSGGGAGSRVNFNDPRAVAVARGKGEGVLLSRRGDTREYRELGKHLSVTSGETDEWGKSLFSGWKAGLTGDEFMSIVRYTESDYRPVNAQLRGRLKGSQWKSDRLPPVEFRKVRDNMDSALQKGIIPENIVVYRGGGSFSLREAVQMGKIKEGGIFRDKGFVSTSITEHAAFAKPVQIKIRVPAGTHGAFVGWNGFTAFKNEAELILPRNQRFLVRKVETHTQGVRLELDLL